MVQEVAGGGDKRSREEDVGRRESRDAAWRGVVQGLGGEGSGLALHVKGGRQLVQG